MKIHALFNRQVREHINNTVFFAPNEQDSDIAIILGAGSVTGEIARTANQDLLHQEFYPKGVLITGGVTIDQPLVYHGLRLIGAKITQTDCTNGLKEANYAYQNLDQKARKTVVFHELSATNTGQNFANIAGEINAIGARTATVYCLAPTQQRVIDTARVHMPNVNVTTKPIYPWFSKDFWLKSWHKNPVSAHYVLSEFHKIDPDNKKNYYNRGFCARAPR